MCWRRGRQTTPTLELRRKLHHHQNQYTLYKAIFYKTQTYILNTHSLSLCLTLSAVVPVRTVIQRSSSNLAVFSFGTIWNKETSVYMTFSSSNQTDHMIYMMRSHDTITWILALRSYIRIAINSSTCFIYTYDTINLFFVFINRNI